MYTYLIQQPDYSSPALPYAGGLRQRAKFAATLRTRFGSVLRRWKLRRTIAALQALDDRMLNDIGLTRSEIPAAVTASEFVERGAGPSISRDFGQPRTYALAA